MSRAILMVENAGYGDTSVPADALLQPGAVLVINDENDGTKSDAVVLAVVPTGGCIEYAIADQNKQPRPLVVSDNHAGETLYVIEHLDRRLYIPHTQMKRGIEAAKAAGLE
jgi:hypothetical protein